MSGVFLGFLPLLIFYLKFLVLGNPDEMKAFSFNILDANLIKFQAPNEATL